MKNTNTIQPTLGPTSEGTDGGTTYNPDVPSTTYYPCDPYNYYSPCYEPIDYDYDPPDYSPDIYDNPQPEEEGKGGAIAAIVIIVIFIVACSTILTYLQHAAENSTPTNSTSSIHNNNTRNQPEPEEMPTSRNIHTTSSNNNRNSRSQPAQTTTSRGGDLEDIKKLSDAEFVNNILRPIIYRTTPNQQTTGISKNVGPSTDEENGHQNNINNVSSDRCTVCLEIFEDGEEVCTSQNKDCPHYFHRNCIFEWLLTKEVCPCCRRNYFQIDSVRNLDEIFVDVELGQGQSTF